MAQEAVYMLSKLRHEGSFELLRDLRRHPLPQVRAAVAEFAESLPKELASEVVADLLDDLDPRVRGIAARTLAQNPSQTAELLLEKATHKEPSRRCVDRSEAGEPRGLRHRRPRTRGANRSRASSERGRAYSSPASRKTLPLPPPGHLARIRSVTAVEILKRAGVGRHRRVKESARQALMWMKENV